MEASSAFPIAISNTETIPGKKIVEFHGRERRRQCAFCHEFDLAGRG